MSGGTAALQTFSPGIRDPEPAPLVDHGLALFPPMRRLCHGGGDERARDSAVCDVSAPWLGLEFGGPPRLTSGRLPLDGFGS